MDSINKVIRNFSGEDFEQRFNKMTEDILADERVQQFLKGQSEITEKHIERNINELFEYKTQWDNCDRCPGLENCPNIMKGYQPKISLQRNDIHLQYAPCSLKVKDDERRRRQSLIKSLYVPVEVTKVTIEDLHEDTPSRINAIAKALEFVMNVAPRENGRGLYVYGPFGVGKTFLMGAIANKLAEKNFETVFVYVPDFFRELKAGIGDGSYQRKFDEVKNAEILILDDIGAETMTDWVRDDILGALLQFRMMEKLPTLFTSNFDLDELEQHLTVTHRGGLEKVDRLKAKRIMERIKYLNDVIDMRGENKRK